MKILFKAFIKPARFIGTSLVIQGLGMLTGKTTFYTHITLSAIIWVTGIGVMWWVAGNILDDLCNTRKGDPPRRP